MFVNDLLIKFQNSKIAKFFSDSLIFENIDNLSFALLIITIASTAFMQSGVIGLFAILFSFSCIFRAFVKKGETAELSLINKIFILYLLFVLISQMGASYFSLSFKGIIKTITYAAFYFSSVYFFSTNKKRIFPAILIITSLVSIEAIIGILQNISHIEAIATWQDTTNVVDPTRTISRAYGTLQPYNPNLLAGYLLTGISSIFAVMGVSYFKKHKKTLFISLGLFLITIIGIFVTGCRGAYVGFFGFILVVLGFAFYFLKKHFGSFKQIKTKYKAIFGGFFAFCVCLMFMVPSFLDRVLSIFSLRKDSSISFRMNVYEACYQMFLDNKFLGIGVGNKNFREIYGLYMKTGFDALGTYSVPLEIAVESGIFALISFIIFIGLILLRSFRYVLNKEINPINRTLIFSIMLMIVATMFHGFFDTIFFRPQIQIIFWTNIAIFHALTIEREKLKKLRLLK